MDAVCPAPQSRGTQSGPQSLCLQVYWWPVGEKPEKLKIEIFVQANFTEWQCGDETVTNVLLSNKDILVQCAPSDTVLDIQHS